MNSSINKSRLLALRAFSAVAFTLVASCAWAQDTTSTSVRHWRAFDREPKSRMRPLCTQGRGTISCSSSTTERLNI